MSREYSTVILTLHVTMRTNRDPWEMGDALAGFVQSTLEEENPDQAGTIDVAVDDAEIVPVRKRKLETRKDGSR